MDSRTNPFKEGGDDTITLPLKLEEKDPIPIGPITRSMTKKLTMWIEEEVDKTIPKHKDRTMMTIIHHTKNQAEVTFQ